MKVSKILGQLEIDHDRGVIYFHAEKTSDIAHFGGSTILRICRLPKPVPHSYILDISHMFGQNWGSDNFTVSVLEGIVIEELINSDFKPGDDEAYAYVINHVFQDLGGRITSHFSKMLSLLDWEKIEKVVKEVRNVAHKSNEWTKEKPVFSGFYWYRCTDSVITLCKVIRDGGVKMIGTDARFTTGELDGEWIGPISHVWSNR